MIPDWKPATTTKVPDVTTRGELPRCPSAGAERSGSGKQARQRAKWTSALQGDSLFNRDSSALLDERPTDFFLSLSLSVVQSPRGQRFRSRASLLAFLLKDGEGSVDIKLFDFTASKDDVVTLSQVLAARGKRGGRQKRHANGQQGTTEEPRPPNEPERPASFARRDAEDGEAESCTRAAPSTAQEEEEEEGVGPGETPRGAGRPRAKLHGPAPCGERRNPPEAHRDEEADWRPCVPTLRVEPAADGEDDEDGRGRETDPEPEVGGHRAEGEEGSRTPRSSEYTPRVKVITMMSTGQFFFNQMSLYSQGV